jgi:hypothetical protein
MQCVLYFPGPASGKPVVCVPEIGYGGESRPWELGKWMEVQQVNDARQGIGNHLFEMSAFYARPAIGKRTRTALKIVVTRPLVVIPEASVNDWKAILAITV